MYWVGVLLGIVIGAGFASSYVNHTYEPLADAKCLENTIHIQAPDQRGLDVWTDTGIWCE